MRLDINLDCSPDLFWSQIPNGLGSLAPYRNKVDAGPFGLRHKGGSGKTR
jgi:hypothetical protein